MVPVEAPQQTPEANPVVPTRSVRRATARRASSRRAAARSHRSDSEARVIAFITAHPGSTTGDIARSLNLDPDDVAICLTQLTHAGEVLKASHGYETAVNG